MTQITEALEAARAHILDSYRIWQADDVSAVPPPKSGAGSVIAKIDAVLSFPIAGEGNPLEWDAPETRKEVIRRALKFWKKDQAPCLWNDENRDHYLIRAAFELAAPSSPGKDGGQEVEAVAWSERENAFTDFWEQCPKLVDASDVGKARQAFFAGMDAASFFDSVAIKTTTGLVERLRKRADEDQACADNSKVIVDALSEQMRLFESREGHNVYAVRMAVDHKSSLGRDSRYAADLREAAEILSRPQPASTALVERLTKALEPFAKLNVPNRPEGNAGFYSVRHSDIQAARSALASAQSTSREGER